MKSPSRPLDCVAGQVKGPFAQVQADVIPGNQFSAENCLHPGCLPACRLCPILFVMWGGLREGAEVHGDKVFSLPSENSVTPSRSLRRHLRLWGRLVSGSSRLCHLPAGALLAGYFTPLCLRFFLSKKG